MNVKYYRAKSLPEALQMIQHELGPDATVLQTREVWDGFLRGLLGRRRVEVTASNDVVVKSAFPTPQINAAAEAPFVIPTDDARVPRRCEAAFPPAHGENHVERLRNDVAKPTGQLEDAMRELSGRFTPSLELPKSLFRVYTDLLEAEIDEDVARSLIGALRDKATLGELEDGQHINQRLRDLVCSWIRPHGPIAVAPGRQRVVAMVGPTGVGKTTTIAKLAANFRLRDRQRVGLITVDTYRIAAVDQLRTYADIIDLPMEVVATQREMREAMGRLSEMDLILMDTAGRSPKDEVRIQELKMMLAEAKPDEVHLVLSSTSGAKTLVKTTQNFADVGITALLVTKLDEATGLGNLLPLVQETELPLSYLTNGQSVPDDIQIADARQLTEWILTGNVTRGT